jgi:GTP-binding protein EngB required for normal cell division
LIAATKADKIAKSKRAHAAGTIRRALDPPGGTPVVLFSAVTGEGAGEIWSWVRAAAGLR